MPIVAGKEYPYTREGIAAAKLAQAGRNEDNALLGGEVAHISAAEADLLRSRGGAGTINPVTGLREYLAVGFSPGGSGMGFSVSPSSPSSAPPGVAGFGGYLPPGFTAAYGGRGISVHPAIAQRFSGRTLAEKVNIYSQKKAREAAAWQAPHLEGQRLAAAAATPAPAPAPVALADLAGSEALAASSLDPFSFSPATLSTDENVLVPFDAALGTLPVGDQAPTLVPSVLEEPDIFNPQTGFVEPQPTFAQGGAVMPGLGFRPLGYDDGGTADKIWSEFDAVTKSDFTKAEMAQYLYSNLTNLEMMAAENPSRAQMLESVKQWSNFGDFMKNIMSSSGGELATGTIMGLGHAAPTETFEVLPPEEQDLPPYLNPSNEDLRSPKPGFSTTYRSGQPPTTQIDEMETMFTLPGMQAGGHVGRGTMAGELGRRGDLSVRQAGETMFERMKRLRGYANGGYADGYHTPRGTMAGELAPKGSLPVRVAGESMGELHKRHQDQDWYNRMGGGLGSLGRRRGIA